MRFASYSCVSNIRAVRNGNATLVEDDKHVYELKEGDNLTFEKVSEPQAPEQEADTSHEPHYDSYLDYLKDHFANWRAGFWAICGKVRWT